MTRYEQGFLTKCAELGVPEKLAGVLFLTHPSARKALSGNEKTVSAWNK